MTPDASPRPLGTIMPVAGHDLHVRLDGPAGAPPLVLVHGFLGSLRWFDRLVPLLAGDFRLIRSDLLGHGFSGKPRSGYSPEEQAAVLRALLDELDVSGPAVVGFSLGADVAVALGESGFPLRRLVLVDEGPDYSLATPPAVNKVLRMPVVGPLLHAALPASGFRRAVEGFLAPGASLDSVFDEPARVVGEARAVPYAAFSATQAEKERYVADMPLDARVAQLALPTLVLFGAQDQVYRARPSCERYGLLPNATAEVIEDAGHSPVVERPEHTADRVRAFVSAG
ncbi:alpha/beta hydrolase [Streptomyces sp. NPDC047002]|uniref:alpha/beta fold hydrolase n=1 Tax=Streptomyces sp. NPDC047002 TaxID=3155475 RepID=UPI0034536F7E